MATLIRAILNADIDTIKTLVKQGADVNEKFGKPMRDVFKIQDANKITPIVKFLVENGASVNGGLPFDDSPLSLARQRSLPELVKWMSENANMAVDKMISEYINRPVATHLPEDGCGCDEDVDCGCPNSLYKNELSSPY